VRALPCEHKNKGGPVIKRLEKRRIRHALKNSDGEVNMASRRREATPKTHSKLPYCIKKMNGGGRPILSKPV